MLTPWNLVGLFGVQSRGFHVVGTEDKLAEPTFQSPETDRTGTQSWLGAHDHGREDVVQAWPHGTKQVGGASLGNLKRDAEIGWARLLASWMGARDTWAEPEPRVPAPGSLTTVPRSPLTQRGLRFLPHRGAVLSQGRGEASK